LFKKIRKLFGSRKSPAEMQEASRDIPTIPIIQSPSQAASTKITEKKPPGLPQLLVGCGQSVGKVRDHNEDAILSMATLSANDDGYLPIGLFIVADGMGGHKQGEVASSLAVRIVAREVVRRVIMKLLDSRPSPPEEGIQEILEESVLEAHRAITKEAPGSGTTLTAALILGKQLSLAHVGDSRAYAFSPEGEAIILTRDHSLVKRMMELGHLTEEEASIHPQRNVLYRALGQGEPFTPDVSTAPVPAPGHLLLCSDGLWGQVDQNEIIRIIQKAPSPESACQMLVDAANKAGGPDNISVILVRLPQYPD
jgi:serine/threonine protein phosphatase PrpC